MNILSECKTILTYAGLTETKQIQIGGKMINRTIIRIAMICLLFTAVVVEFSVCLKGRHKSVDNILLPLHLGLSCLATLLIYVRLMIKADKIHQLIGYVENVVTKRNLTWFFVCLWRNRLECDGNRWSLDGKTAVLGRKQWKWDYIGMNGTNSMRFFNEENGRICGNLWHFLNLSKKMSVNSYMGIFRSKMMWVSQ